MIVDMYFGASDYNRKKRRDSLTVGDLWIENGRELSIILDPK